MKVSPYFSNLKGREILCQLCPKQCRLRDGDRGFCRVRMNRGGTGYTLAYGNPCVVHLDPIERQPLFHVLPSSQSLSLTTAGCNFHCMFCQNWEFALASPEHVYSYDMPPELVLKKGKQMNARAVAYTYGEPTVFFEYMLDVAAGATEGGLLNVLHSNGFISHRPLRELIDYLDAANIDLKAFRQSFYEELCAGKLQPVLETLKILKHSNIHLEITNLVIPTKNDDMVTIREMCTWITGELGKDTPVHFLRFYPLYRLSGLPPTPVATLEGARDIALSCGLEYVYIGNVPGHKAWNTFCPRCGRLVIERIGYMIGEINLKGGKCRFCGNPIPGIWD